MIKRKKYLKALKIVEAYHAQILAGVSLVNEAENQTKNTYKDKEKLEVGDFVECIEVHKNSAESLTKEEKYEVLRTELSYNGSEKYFSIRVDSGKLKKYNCKNTQFKALN